jgi:hypothetical protein
MATNPLQKKLLIKNDQRILIFNPPEGYVDSLGELPEGASLDQHATGSYDFVHLFAKDSEELRRLADLAIRRVKPEGLLWVSYPKRSSKVKTDLARDTLRTLLEGMGYIGVSLVSIDDVWSAMRFRRPGSVGR